MALHGMEVTVKKAELLGKLEANLGNHRKKFEELKKDYIVKRLDEMEGMASDLREGELSTDGQQTKLRVPKDYSDDYAAATEMVKAHQGETLVLTHEQFNLLWLDRHDWHDDFARVSTQNSGYSSKKR